MWKVSLLKWNKCWCRTIYKKKEKSARMKESSRFCSNYEIYWLEGLLDVLGKRFMQFLSVYTQFYFEGENILLFYYFEKCFMFFIWTLIKVFFYLMIENHPGKLPLPTNPLIQHLIFAFSYTKHRTDRNWQN